MTPESRRHERLAYLFQAALEQPADERLPFLSLLCQGDSSLLAELQGLLAADADFGDDAVLCGTTLTLPPIAPGRADPLEHELPSLLEQRYRLQKVIGRGGFGIVYLGRDERLHNKPVVVKFLIGGTRHDEWFRKKFRDEIEVLSTLNHPGIVEILDAGQTADGTPYLVMQYVEGQTLRSLIAPGGIQLDVAAAIVQQIGYALDAAHACGIVHRDLKPENIMVQQSRAGVLVRLIDFGIATIREEGFRRPHEPTRVAGSLPYMAPEQLRGQVGAATDIFAMGVIAWELLEGEFPPFADLDKAHHRLWTKIPELAIAAILRAVSAEPADRFQTAGAFGNELAGALRAAGTRSAQGAAKTQPRVLDVAMARQIPIHKPAEVVALIRRTASGGLAAVLEVEKDHSLNSDDIRSKAIQLEFQLDSTGGIQPLVLGLRLDCPDFEPRAAFKTLQVPPGGDSDVCTFLITPRHLGELQVNVELTRDDVLVASRALKTEVTPSDRLIDPAKVLVSIPMSVLVRAAEEVQPPTGLRQISPTPGEPSVDPHTLPAVVASSPTSGTLVADSGVAREAQQFSRNWSHVFGVVTIFTVLIGSLMLVPFVLHRKHQAPIGKQVKHVPPPEISAPLAKAGNAPRRTQQSVQSSDLPPKKQKDSVQGESTLTARALFYGASVRTPSVTKPAARPVTLGLRYSVLKREASGEWREVDAESTFVSGDQIRVQMTANTSGYLYVVNEGSGGTWHVLFPTPDVAGGSNRVGRGETRIVPSTGAFVFNTHPGAEKLFIFLSREPLSDLDRSIYLAGNLQNPLVAPSRQLLTNASVGNNIVERLTNQVSASNQVLEKVGGANSTDATEMATYIVNGSGDPGVSVQAVLKLNHVQASVRKVGPVELNAKGKGFCDQMAALWKKYPFNPNATPQATVAEVNGVFHKPDGALWTLYDMSLQKVLAKQGSTYVANPSGGVNLNPAFVNFFNQAAAFSDFMYQGNTPDPHFGYTLKPIPTEGVVVGSNLDIDGQTLNYPGTGNAMPQQFTWKAAGTHEFKSSLKIEGGQPLYWLTGSGLWSVFQFFAQAEHVLPADSGQTLEWILYAGKTPMSVKGKPVTVRIQVDMGGAPLILVKGYFARMACVSDIAN